MQPYRNATGSKGTAMVGDRSWTGHSNRARVAVQRALIVMLLGCAASGAMAAPPGPVPVLVVPSSGEHHVGKVVFVELVTPDLPTAEKFYAAMFGWTFRDRRIGSTPYAQALLDGRSIAGLVQKSIPAGQPRQPAWLTFFAVRDVDSVTQAALHGGAKLLFGPRDIPDRGRGAVFADPQGAVFAVVASSSGDPPDVLPSPGEWIWASLIAQDADTDVAFYQALFDYEVFDLPAPPGGQHALLAAENYVRAAATTPSSIKSAVHSHWLNFVRVEDAERSSQRAVALGGRILVEPHVDRHGGKVAVVADPLGAPFGLLEWTDGDSDEVTR